MLNKEGADAGAVVVADELDVTEAWDCGFSAGLPIDVPPRPENKLGWEDEVAAVEEAPIWLPRLLKGLAVAPLPGFIAFVVDGVAWPWAFPKGLEMPILLTPATVVAGG